MSKQDERIFELELRRKYDGAAMDNLKKSIDNTGKDIADLKQSLHTLARDLEEHHKDQLDTKKLLSDVINPAVKDLARLKTKGTGFVLGLTLAGIGSGASATALLKLMG